MFYCLQICKPTENVRCIDNLLYAIIRCYRSLRYILQCFTDNLSSFITYSSFFYSVQIFFGEIAPGPGEHTPTVPLTETCSLQFKGLYSLIYFRMYFHLEYMEDAVYINTTSAHSFWHLFTGWSLPVSEYAVLTELHTQRYLNTSFLLFATANTLLAHYCRRVMNELNDKYW